MFQNFILTNQSSNKTNYVSLQHSTNQSISTGTKLIGAQTSSTANQARFLYYLK